MIIADNLAAHALGGFFCNFSTVQRFSRHCGFTKDQLQHSETFFDFAVRTTVGYNENLLSVQDYPQLSATYGIKEPSCFSKLVFMLSMDFHLTWHMTYLKDLPLI